MIADLPFNAGLLVGRLLGLPALSLGFVLYACTAFSRKMNKSVKSAVRFALSLLFCISVFLTSLAVLEAAKESDYDLRQLVPVPLHTAFAALGTLLSGVLAHRWVVSAVDFVQEYRSFISNAVVAAFLVPLFTNGIRAFLATLRFSLCALPNMLHGMFRGFCGSFEYLLCAVSLTNHQKHPEW
jgi:uncharacterized membrane protein YesL